MCMANTSNILTWCTILDSQDSLIDEFSSHLQNKNEIELSLKKHNFKRKINVYF